MHCSAATCCHCSTVVRIVGCQLDECDVWALANIAWALANIAWALANIAWALANIAWALANIAWALANIAWALANIAWALANIAWALAKLKCTDTAFMHAAAGAASSRSAARRFDAQNTANTLWPSCGMWQMTGSWCSSC